MLQNIKPVENFCIRLWVSGIKTPWFARPPGMVFYTQVLEGVSGAVIHII
jgi:hypothetical protein